MNRTKPAKIRLAALATVVAVIMLWALGVITAAEPRSAMAQSPPAFGLEWDHPDDPVIVGESFEIMGRIYSVNGTYERGGITFTFPDITGGFTYNRGREAKLAAADFEVVRSQRMNFFIWGEGDTIENPSLPETRARHLFIESDGVDWSSSSDRTLRLRITPHRAGIFEYRVRGWLCANGYQDCERIPYPGHRRANGTDQQGQSVVVSRVTVVDVPTPTPTDTPEPPTPTPTDTPEPPTPTPTRTPTPVPPTNTPTPPPTWTPTHTPVPPPTWTPTHTPVPPTTVPTHTPAPPPTWTPTNTPAPPPTWTPTITPVPPTPITPPTSTPIPPPTSAPAAPTNTPTPAPTNTPPPPTNTPVPPPTSTPLPPPNCAAGQVCADIQGERTEVNVGDEVRVAFSMQNSLAQPPMTVSITLQAPSGWTIVGEGIADACTSQCSAVYQIASGAQRAVIFTSRANEAGSSTFQGRMEWYFGDDRSRIYSENRDIRVIVTEPTPTNTPVPPPTVIVRPPPTPTGPCGGMCNPPCPSATPPGTAAANMLLLMGPLGLIAALKVRRRQSPGDD